MPRPARFARCATAGALTTLILGVSAVAWAQAPAPPVWEQAAVHSGRIQGTVRDQQGRAVAGVSVSAFGIVPARSALTDPDGRFSLPLPAGEYVLRAHRTGYESARDVVWVPPSAPTRHDIVIARIASDHQVLLAGLDGAAATPAQGADASAGADDPHDVVAWVLRHLKRTVLHEDGVLVPPPARRDAAPKSSFFDWALAGSARLATSIASPDISGQVNLMTIGSTAPGALDRSVAYVAVTAPVGTYGQWTVRGALTAGDASSWVLHGEFRVRDDRPHAFVAGVSYGTHAYGATDGPPVPGAAAVSRSVGAVYGADRWHLSPRVELDYGLRLDRYDYVDPSAFVSPQIGARVRVLPRTFVLVSGAQQVVAPGGEEFLPPSAGPWLPPERSFAPLPQSGFVPERVHEAEFGVEQQFGDRSVTLRRFVQTTTDQLATIFSTATPLPLSDGSAQYLVGSVGGVAVSGWAVRLSGVLAPRLSGSIDYAVENASWTPGGDAAVLASLVPSVARLNAERGEQLQDVTTSLEANVPETATRVTLVYRFNTGFASAAATAPVTSGRFDLQVSQALPFRVGPGARWEALLALRNLFRDATEPGSIYDELLAVGAPLRVIGGVRVRF